MDIFSKDSNIEGVTIQIKPINKGKSRSFTIKNIGVDETYNRTIDLFQALSKTDTEVTITHYKNKPMEE